MNRISNPREKLLLAVVLPLVVAFCFAPPATARVYDGLDIVIESMDTPAKSGQIFTAQLRVMADRPLKLTEFSIAGDQWSNLSWSSARGTDLSPGAPLVVSFSGKPNRADAPLTIHAQSENKTIRRIITLGGEVFERQTQALPTKIVKDPGPTPWVSQWALANPVQPAPPRLDPAIDYAADDREGAIPTRDTSKDRDIRIRGRFIYLRDGTTVMGADGMSVHVYDDDPFFDDHLGSGVTDAQGNFDFTVHWESQPGQTHPDLKLEIITENSEIQLRRVGAINPYKFVFGPWDNYSGSDFDLGVGIAANESDHDIPHLITNYTRNWRYMAYNGHDTRFLEVRWPGDEDDGAYYNSVSETIQLAGSDRWESGTQSHEFGHHIMNCLSELPDFDYCNGFCDDNPPFECGHCLWCEESQAIAWSEGWADYIGHTIPRTFEALYGFPCLNAMDMESANDCGQNGLWGDPSITEGFTAAALVDIVDDQQDNDPHFPDYDDRSEISQRNLLDVLHSDHAMRTPAYLADLKEHFPGDREDMWWSAMNNGFNIDEEQPDPVFPIICLSHTVNVSSANQILRFFWNRPDDDASGVRGYSYVVSGYGYPTSPDHYMDLEGETTVEIDPLLPGTYYFSIRTVDWDGNWDDDYTSAGPFIIAAPQPCNLVFDLPTGWDYYVVPSNTTGATLSSCPLPTTLDSMEPTYWNVAARNEGDVYTTGDTYTACEVDGNIIDTFNWGNLPGWSPFIVMNEGPELVLGGLHTITGSLDPEDLVSETDETDNKKGKQFAWRPPLITQGTVYSNGLGVPDPTGGWETLGTAWAFYNCYGMTFAGSGWWNAFVMWSDHPEVDYDLRLHEVNESPLGGFLFAAEVSSMPAGWADAVLVNRNTMGFSNWDAAVLNHHGDSGTHRFQHVISTEVAYGDSLTETMGENEYVMLREFEVGYLETGGISLDLWTDPPQANVSFSWRDADFTTGELMEADAYILTDSYGYAHLDVEALEEGYTCIMICRKPADGDDDLQVTYRIRPTLPDLKPAEVAGWHSPIVPRADDAGTPTSVPLPAILLGDQEQTWFNYAVTNNSSGTAWGAMRFYIQVDNGAGSFGTLHLFDFDGFETKTFNDDGPRFVKSGRHTVVLDLDRYNYMVELDDDNNTFGEQYIWTPAEMVSGETATRTSPPEMMAGWGDISVYEPIYYNCDGVRAASTGAYWRAIAVMPQADTDVDLRLHEANTTAKSGFGANLARSSWAVGQSDFVLVNFNLTANRAFDAGILATSGYDDYTCEVLNEQWLGEGETTVGPVTMNAGEILDLYEIRLPVGTWNITLANTSGTVDWGLAFHPGDEPYMTKADILDEAAAWLEPSGAGEQVTVTIDALAYYPISVWKVGAADLDQAGTYTLEIVENDTSPVFEEIVPAFTRLASVFPNPFNPQTTVQFDLAEPSTVNLAVYDVMGRKVKTLVQEYLTTGRHHQVWLGKDETGQQVASGMYVVRLQTATTTDLQKIMLLK